MSVVGDRMKANVFVTGDLSDLGLRNSWPSALVGGYITDSFVYRHGSRLPLISWLSIGQTLSACIPFFEIGMQPVWHYFISIALFDGFWSVNAIAKGGLFTEIAKNESQRINMQRISSLFGNVHFIVSALGFFAFDLNDGRHTFQCLLLSTGGLSLLCTLVSVRKLRHHTLQQARSDNYIRARAPNLSAPSRELQATQPQG